MNVKQVKAYIKRLLDIRISIREKQRGTGVYLPETYGQYCSLCGEINLLKQILEDLGEVIEYDPQETEEDDAKYNYCGYIGRIGQIE